MLKKVLIDPVYLNEPKVRLSGPKVVPNGLSVAKNYPKKSKKSLNLNQNCQGSQ